MSSRARALCLAGLFAGCAAVSFAGCSEDSSKKKVGIPVGEAGQAGEAGAPAGGTGGSVTTPEGGAAGESPGAAGEGGAPVVGAAGEGGAVAEGGAAGAGPVACQPTGAETGITLSNGPSQKVCRGAIVTTQFSATTSDTSFTCCGVSDSSVPFSVDIEGVTQGNEGDNYGRVSLLVPTDAPLGLTSITATCSAGAATNPFNIDVTAAPVPVVTGLENSQLSSGATVQVNGTGMDLITSITAVSVDGNGSADCGLDTETQSADSVSCLFDGIGPGDYYIVVTAADCGSAVNQPILTIKPLPT